MCWNELLTTDRNAAIDFYIAVFGVERGEVMAPVEYAMLKGRGTEVAGVMQITPEMGEFPPHWSVYFGVDNADAVVEKASRWARPSTFRERTSCRWKASPPSAVSPLLPIRRARSSASSRKSGRRLDSN